MRGVSSSVVFWRAAPGRIRICRIDKGLFDPKDWMIVDMLQLSKQRLRGDAVIARFAKEGLCGDRGHPEGMKRVFAASSAATARSRASGVGFPSVRKKYRASRM